MKTIAQRIRGEKWKYITLMFLHLYEVVVYYLKVDYNGLKICIVNTRMTTNKKV